MSREGEVLVRRRGRAEIETGRAEWGEKSTAVGRGLGFSTLNRHLKQQTVWSLWALNELDGPQRSY